MQIEPLKVVLIHYTLTNNEGEVLDKSDDSPMAYIHGAGNIIPGLENALTGRVVGDKFEVSIPPEEAYGLRDDELVQMVPKSAFQGVDGDILPGMRFQARSPEGMQLLTVLGVDDEEVILDGNHPMAGLTLHFAVEVTEIRDATIDEISHGHVHGAGGHHH